MGLRIYAVLIHEKNANKFFKKLIRKAWGS